MTIVIKDPNAVYTRHLGNLYLPVTDGLVLLHYLGESADKSVINYAPDGNAGIVGGVPTYNANSVIFSAGNFIDTDVLDSNSHTMFAVVKRTITPAVMLGNISTTNDFSGLYIYNSPFRSFFQAWTSASSNEAIAGTAMTVDGGFEFIAGIMDDTAKTKTQYRMTAGITGSAINTAGKARVLSGTNPMRIGAVVGGASFLGAIELGCVGMFDRAIGTTELAVIYAHIKARYAALGITI